MDRRLLPGLIEQPIKGFFKNSDEHRAVLRRFQRIVSTAQSTPELLPLLAFRKLQDILVRLPWVFDEREADAFALSAWERVHGEEVRTAASNHPRNRAQQLKGHHRAIACADKSEIPGQEGDPHLVPQPTPLTPGEPELLAEVEPDRFEMFQIQPGLLQRRQRNPDLLRGGSHRELLRRNPQSRPAQADAFDSEPLATLGPLDAEPQLGHVPDVDPPPRCLAACGNPCLPLRRGKLERQGSHRISSMECRTCDPLQRLREEALMGWHAPQVIGKEGSGPLARGRQSKGAASWDADGHLVLGFDDGGEDAAMEDRAGLQVPCLERDDLRLGRAAVLRADQQPVRRAVLIIVERATDRHHTRNRVD